MTSTLVVLGILLILLVTGFIRLIRHRLELVKSHIFTDEYLKRFSDFVEKNYFDGGDYTWLTEKAYPMQIELGSFGKMTYKPPFANYFIHDYDLILNLLPEIRKHKTDRSMFGPGPAYQEQVSIVAETLIRFRGILNEQLDFSGRQLWNPFVWLREGVQTILQLPLLIFQWFGLISSSVYYRITNAPLFGIVTGLITLIGLVGSIFTIVLGWEQFLKLMEKWW